jgi:hypothetical protein
MTCQIVHATADVIRHPTTDLLVHTTAVTGAAP